MWVYLLFMWENCKLHAYNLEKYLFQSFGDTLQNCVLKIKSMYFLSTTYENNATVKYFSHHHRSFYDFKFIILKICLDADTGSHMDYTRIVIICTQ